MTLGWKECWNPRIRELVMAAGLEGHQHPGKDNGQKNSNSLAERFHGLYFNRMYSIFNSKQSDAC